MSNQALLNRVRPERLQAPSLTEEAQATLIESVRAAVTAEFRPEEILDPGVAVRARIRERILAHVAGLSERQALRLSTAQEDGLARQVEHLLLGFGFLEAYLPPARDDLTEIALSPSGALYLKRKGEARFERVAGFEPPPPAEVQRVMHAILGPLGRRVSEAEPIVSGAGYPALNVRLFEEAPITPERLLAWGALDSAMVEFLAQAVRARRSLLIAGGTGTGKTTLLNMVSDFVPRDDRVVSIEDTCELRLNVPHWVPLETRPPSIEGRYAITALDLVNAALRMTPDWIIVGEVRAGDVAAALLQTQISGHAGLSTIHARSPWETVQTLTLRCLQSGQFPKVEAIKVLIALAVDVVVQLEWDPAGVRRVTRIAEVGRQLRGGEVQLSDVFRFDPSSMTWQQACAPDCRRQAGGRPGVAEFSRG